MKISYFAIYNLFGQKNIEIPIEDNKLIIVAENGAGKTTLLRIFYLFLSKQWNTLIEYDFEKIKVMIDDKEYFFVKNDYSDTAIPSETIKKLTIDYPSYRKFFEEELIKYSVDKLLKDDFLIGDIETKYDVPRSLLYSVLNEITFLGYSKDKYDWKGTFLYLPTYRRIERGFGLLYGDINKRLEQHIRQLLPEVDIKIQNEKESSNSSYSETENDLLSIFEIIWEKRDFERWSSKHDDNFHMELIEFGMDDVHFRISNLLRNLGNNQDILALYLNKCNRYLTDNKALVISINNKFLEVKIPESEKPLSIATLSAGEKQIISLFSYLLANPSQTYVIIDEPELSLSMNWQEMLLNDIAEFDVNGIFVATHSPFIVSDFFKYYTHGINEFKKL